MLTTFDSSAKGSGITLSGGDLTATKSGSAWSSCRATTGKTSGKHYFELVFTFPGNKFSGGGVGPATTDLLSFSDEVNEGVSFAPASAFAGQIENQGSITAISGAWSSGDVIGVAVDVDTTSVWFSRNGTWVGTGDPVAGTNPQANNLVAGAVYPWVKLNQSGDVATARFLLSEFSYTPPSGFEPWDISVGLSAIASSEAFGSMEVIGPKYLSLTGISTGEQFGSLEVIGPKYISLQAIGSAFAFGDNVLNGPQYISLSGLESASAFGLLEYAGPKTIELVGIASSAAFGDFDSLRQHSVVSTSGIGLSPVAAASVLGVTLSQELGLLSQTATQQTATIQQSLGINPALGLSIPQTLSQTLGLNGATVSTNAIGVIGALGLVDALQSRHSHVLLSLLGMADTVWPAEGATISESLALSAANLISAGVIRTSGIGLQDVTVQQLIISVVASDTFGLDDTTLLQKITQGTITDGFTVEGVLLGPSTATTWVMNTRTRAVTEYEGWDFNSFAKVGQRYLGANASGLYWLDSDTDDSTAIETSIATGILQPGGVKKSRPSYAYIGIRGAGEFVFTVTDEKGASYDYPLDVTNMKTARVQFGKGLAGRYYTFTLTSAGQDFDLDSVEIIHDTLSRKV